MQAAVSNPILECVTHYKEICHTSYVTNFVAKKGKDCTNEFEKKCTIVLKNVEVNETIRSCLKPLQRHCIDETNESITRIKRTVTSELEIIGKF